MAQEKIQSHAETFSRRSGTLVSKEFVTIGNLKNVKVQLVRYRDMITEQEEKAVRFEYDHYDGYSDYPDTKVGVIDKDEFEGLVKSLDIIWDSVYQTYPSNYTEVNFTSRSGFRAGCFHSEKGWQFYLQMNEFDNNSSVYLKKEDTYSLLELLTKSRDKLLS